MQVNARQDTLVGSELSLSTNRCAWDNEHWDGKYRVFYCDSPWEYRAKVKGRGTVTRHYPTLSIEQLKRFQVKAITAKDSVLFMWITPPLLPEAFEVIKAWDFKFKTKAFVWVKTTKRSGRWHWGTGYFTRANTEDCFIAVRGKGLERLSKGVHQVIDMDDTLIAPVGAHSVKPLEARVRIVELFGDVPRIELFAREVVPGWHGHGLDYPGEGIEIGFSDEVETG